MRVIRFSLAFCAVFSISALVAGELQVGETVIFSGGASHPPEERQVGLKLDVTLRGGSPVGPVEAPAGPGPKKERPLEISDLSDRESDELLDTIRAGDPNLRASALTALAVRGPEHLPRLREALGDHDDRVVILGCKLLGQARDTGAVDDLLRLVDSGKRTVEQAAVRSLGEIGDARALDDLERLSDIESPDISPLAREAIEKISRSN